MPLKHAKAIEEIYLALSPEPLREPADLDAFYCSKVNELRGQDAVARLKLALRRAHGASEYKAFLMGHPGVGKSTELARLAREIEGEYRTISFSATNEVDPGSFQPFDFLLIMLTEVVERTARSTDEGGAGKHPSEASLRDLWDWFASEKRTHKEAVDMGARLEVGAGVSRDSIWSKVLGLFAHLKGDVKFGSTREKEKVEYRLKRLPTLIEIGNRLLVESNQLLRDRTRREWLFVWEDFDKPGIPPDRIESLFLTYANVLKELRAHLILTIPVALVYSSKAPQLPFPSDRTICIPDTPVYDQGHNQHQAGRDAIRAALEARVDPVLFDDGEMMRLIVASGGNFRDLFAMANQAADAAILRKTGVTSIASRDVDSAISMMRSEYLRRLGQGDYDRDSGPYEHKAARLLRIYNRDPAADVPDQILHALLRARAVQEFNGERWFGVHPLVVDILGGQKHVRTLPDGRFAGGSE